MTLTSRTQTRLLVALLTGGCSLAIAPGAFAAGSGGTGLAGGAAPGTGSQNPLVQPASVPVSATAGGVTLWTVAATQTARSLAFSGTAPASTAGETIMIERAGGTGPELRWAAVATATIAPDGSFAGTWHAMRAGRFQIEAVLLGESKLTDSSRGAGSGAAAPTSAGEVTTPALTVSVYQSAIATLYGPGFYGQQTACGLTLQRTTLGVASRTLPCGTTVSLMFGNRLISVPVIDRGPYANGADWDLTMATATALGMRSTATIGALVPTSTAGA